LEDTVLDLCGQTSAEDVVHLLTRAVQRHRTSPQLLLRRLRQRSRSGNRELITAVLAEVAVGAQSPLELRYLRDVEKAHGLPRGRRQAPRGPYLRDVLYEEYALLAELDGRPGHEGTGRFRDMTRDNFALLAGEATLRLGWPDVAGDPCGVARLVARVLQQRGWTGEIVRCHRCRLVP
jgi:very-short-patch-repair endonuclease